MASLKTWLKYWVGAVAITFGAGFILVLIEIFADPSQMFLLVALIITLFAGNLWARRTGVSLWSER